MREGTWIINEAGEQEFAYYNELDSEILPQLWRPVGSFCYRADDFILLPLAEVPFYLKDWLPKQGKAIIYAPAKSGKSHLAVQLARCVACGEEFLGIPTSQGRVLYIQCELGMKMLQQRMQSTGQDYEDVFVGTTFSMKLDTKGGQEQLWHALEAVKPQVLILDPWYKLLKGDENEAHDTEIITDFLDSVIEGFDCSVLLMGHPGKDISKGNRGSTIIEDWVDSYIEMKKVSKLGEPLRARLTPKLLRHAELPLDSIEVELQNFEFVRVDAKTTVYEEVMEYIKNRGDSLATSPKDLREAEIGSLKSIHNALERLVNEEKVKKIGKGEYLWCPT